MARPFVVIFARAPRYGAVKTRLARDIGATDTLRFYKRTLDRLVRRLRRDARFEVALAITPDHACAGLPRGLALSGQGHGDLGQRMVRALRRAGRRPAMVIGSDVPGITALGRRPYVLCPARDGGYWLIGARHPSLMRSDALAGVRWSSPHAMQDTIERLGDVALLDDVLDDVDDGQAYRRAAFAR
jgi:uncharacterized protein